MIKAPVQDTFPLLAINEIVKICFNIRPLIFPPDFIIRGRWSNIEVSIQQYTINRRRYAPPLTCDTAVKAVVGLATWIVHSSWEKELRDVILYNSGCDVGKLQVRRIDNAATDGNDTFIS